MAGIRGFERKKRRCKAEGRKLYRTSKDSMESRQRKKLSGSKSWYKKRKRNEDDEVPINNGREDGSKEGVRRNKKRKVEGNTREGKEGNNLKTRSVLFVD